MRWQLQSICTDSKPLWVQFSLPMQLSVHLKIRHPLIDPVWGAGLSVSAKQREAIHLLDLTMAKWNRGQWALLLRTAEHVYSGQPQRNTGQRGWERQGRQADTEILKPHLFPTQGTEMGSHTFRIT